MTLGVRGIAQDGAGAVMLVRHSYTPGWHLPGGGVERDETAEQAMCKEFAEEAGIAPTAVLQLIGVYLNPLFRGDHVMLFRCSGWQACPTDSEGEILERGFFPLEALPPGTTISTRARLKEVFASAPPSAHW
jgi:8-oxo-dGTP pyrophosphatase MutT (NUDIX family)